MGIKTYIKKNIKPYFQRQVPVFISLTDDKRLEGRTALIIGGSRGIGFAIAKSFMISGANVIICGRNTDALEQAVTELKDYGNVKGIQLDITDIPSMEEILGGFLSSTHKKVDILVNSAGVNSGDKFGMIKETDFDAVINTNLKGMLFVSQIVANYMRKNGINGNILHIASTGAFRPADTAYRISKWGVRGLTLGMAKSLAPYGIVVNAIAPGPTATKMLKASNDDLTRARNPIGRMATVEEIAELAKELVSESGRLIVGEIVSMSGGAGIITFDDVDY